MTSPTKYAPGTRGFMQWMKANQSSVYKRAMPKLSKLAKPAGMGLVAPDPAQTASVTAAPKSFADSVKDILMGASQVYLTREQMKSQQKILDLQLQRAQAGLAPLDIDMSQYGIQPAQVNVGVASDTMKTVLYIAGGAGLLFVFKALMKR